MDVHLRVAAVGVSSITYEFEMTRDGEAAVRGRALAVLLSEARGKPVPWPDAQRRLLLSAGQQAPELLVTE